MAPCGATCTHLNEMGQIVSYPSLISSKQVQLGTEHGMWQAMVTEQEIKLMLNEDLLEKRFEPVQVIINKRAIVQFIHSKEVEDTERDCT